MILFIAFGVYSFFKYHATKPSVSTDTYGTDMGENNTSGNLENPVEDFSKDVELGISRVTVKNTLFDLVITDETVKPTEIDIYNNKLIVADPNSGKVYISVLGDYKFLPIEETFFGINSLVVSSEGKLFFGDAKGIDIYSIDELLLLNSYDTKVSGGLSIFGKYIYSFEGNKLLRYSDEDGKLISALWGESSDFTDTKGIQIAYSVYVATSNNTIAKYTIGKKDSFEVSGLEIPFGNIIDFVVKENFEHVYVADSLNKRVVVLDLSGKFVKQYKYSDTKGWEDIKSIAVDDKESTLYVLDGTKIYEISL